MKKKYVVKAYAETLYSRFLYLLARRLGGHASL
jgi:hypothetical protein